MPPATPAAKKHAVKLADWEHTAVMDVELLSGAGMVRQRPGTLADALRGGRVPNPLRALALKIEYEGVDPKELSDEEVASYEDFKDWYISETVEEPALSPEDVRKIPNSDREQLWLNAIHSFQGKLADLMGSVMELRSFRDGAGRPDASPDGNGDKAAAE